MAEIGKFRTALNGFNRQDVANYIAYLNTRNTAELEQLNNRLQSALNRQKEEEALKEQLKQAQDRCAELEEQLRQLQEKAQNAATESELEAYRRAERTEREAKERAQQICEQAYATLADATVKAEDAARQISTAAEQAATQITAYRDSVLNTRDLLKETVQSLYAIKPEA